MSRNRKRRGASAKIQKEPFQRIPKKGTSVHIQNPPPLSPSPGRLLRPPGDRLRPDPGPLPRPPREPRLQVRQGPAQRAPRGPRPARRAAEAGRGDPNDTVGTDGRRRRLHPGSEGARGGDVGLGPGMRQTTVYPQQGERERVSECVCRRDG